MLTAQEANKKVKDSMENERIAELVTIEKIINEAVESQKYQVQVWSICQKNKESLEKMGYHVWQHPCGSNEPNWVISWENV